MVDKYYMIEKQNDYGALVTSKSYPNHIISKKIFTVHGYSALTHKPLSKRPIKNPPIFYSSSIRIKLFAEDKLANER